MIQVKKGNAYQIGVTVLEDKSVNIAVAMDSENCGLVLYQKHSDRIEKISFPTKYQIGEMYCVNVSGFDPLEWDYNFYADDEIIVDQYAKCIVDDAVYGEVPKDLKASFYTSDFDWENDKPLMIPYCDSLFYLMHPRGFTKHESSGVKNPGTLEAIVEKIPYLKDLGVTGIVLTPCYEFIEKESTVQLQERVPLAYQEKEAKLNYWGYKKGFYFSPKRGYCKEGANASESFKHMVKALHQNGIEVIMQFYFSGGEKQATILKILQYWLLEYHVDGFHLLGDCVPNGVLATEPILKKTKLVYYGFPIEEIYRKKAPAYFNLAECRDAYAFDMRRFLKSDERSLGNVLQHIKCVPKKNGLVHFITEINGFTMADLVSYDRKHNEANGENNMDGNPYNASWNCGVEGPTKKKTILDLRKKQMKNAFALSLFTQSTPMLLMGDEFANSQKGNNNPYCQDNEITWLDWNDLEKNQDLFAFVKRLISFRKSYEILHGEKECTMQDVLECGYPDLSFHSEEAWKCVCDDLTRHFAMLYHDGHTFIYIAINMHWVNHDFALPKLPKGVKWERIFDTSVSEEKQGKPLKSSKKLTVNERSIQVLLAEK